MPANRFRTIGEGGVGQLAEIRVEKGGVHLGLRLFLLLPCPAYNDVMKLGILFEYGTLNGGEHSLFAVLSQLRSEIPAPVILAPASRRFDEICARLQLQRVHYELNTFRDDPVGLTKSLQQVITECQLDLLHANSLSAGRQLGVVSNQLSCPTSAHLRDILKLSGPARRALQQHRQLIAVSQATCDFHVQQGIPASQITVIHNGVDLMEFRPRPPTGWLHRQLGLPPETPLAGTVGQICLRKGHHDLAQAAVLLKDRLPDLHFVVVGQRHSSKMESVQFDESLDEVFAQHGLSHRFHRLGWHQQMQDVYPEFHLVLHAARQEPLGRVLLEAAACGVPIVATAVGGTGEILADDQSACLVPAADPCSLANGIEKLMRNPENCREFTAAARRTMEERFPIALAARRHWIFWKQLLESAAD